MSEVIWYRDPVGFVRPDALTVFVPTPAMSPEEQLNAILRFSIYAAALVFLVRRTATPIVVATFVAALTWGLNEVRENSEAPRSGGGGGDIESRDAFSQPLDYGGHDDHGTLANRGNRGGYCTRPTLDNPFMNVLTSDSVTTPQRAEACDVASDNVQREMETYFSHNLYRDSDDPLDRRTSSRQFYTMPVTTIPGDQTAFARFLWGAGPTCKEGNGGRCAALNDNRHTLR